MDFFSGGVPFVLSPDKMEVPISRADQSSGAHDYDVILVGGGLANCLIALRLAQCHPDLRIVIVEAGAEIGGNKTWSFHGTDVAADDYAFLQPLIRKRWAGQRVMFPELNRILSTPYAMITSETMREAVRASAAITIKTDALAEKIGEDHVELADGFTLSAPCVIDGRGYAPSPWLKVGFQKFAGLELETRQTHGETLPTIMDARIDQLDGFRFFYILPLSPTRMLVEDTRYSDSGDLDRQEIRRAILHYVTVERGWAVSEEIREESGVLPISLAVDFESFWQHALGSARVGMRAGLFQPTTGYSLPEAVRVASLIATRCSPLETALVDAAVRDYARNKAESQRFMRFLNRMLFLGAEPGERYRVLQRFYKLPQDLIERFYAGHLKPMDKVRILAGKPPIPIRNAIRCVSEKGILRSSD